LLVRELGKRFPIVPDLDSPIGAEQISKNEMDGSE
jgi:hypothetical protein